MSLIAGARVLASQAKFRTIAAAVVLVGFVLAACIGRIPVEASDSLAYVAIAEGHGNTIPQPFAGRLFHAHLAAAVAYLAGWPVKSGFVALAPIGLVLFAASLSRLARLSRSAPEMVCLMAASPWLIAITAAAFLPDLWHAALLAAFFAALMGERLYPALVLLLLSCLTREITVLLGIIAAWWYCHKRKWTTAILISIVIIVSLSIVAAVSSSGQGNVHAVGTVLYLVLKVAHNLLRNLFGVTLWADSWDFCPPRAIYDLPNWLAFGHITRVGLCPFEYWQPVTTIGVLITQFGIAPALCLALFRKLPISGAPDVVVIAAVYGSAAYLLGPLSGTNVPRLVGYGWPVFLVALPWALARVRVSRQLLYLLALHGLVLSVPAAATALLPGPSSALLFTLAVGLFGQLLAVRLTRSLQAVDEPS